MATVYVHAESAPEFWRMLREWERETDPGSIYVEPSEGAPIGEEKQFVMVREEFLAYLRKRGFAFRLG